MATSKLSLLLLSVTAIFLLFQVTACAGVQSAKIWKPASISSDSILLAFLDTQYTDFLGLADQASLLQKMEIALTDGQLRGLTIFAPSNRYISRTMDPEFRLFLAEPGNAEWLQQLLSFHIVPRKLPIAEIMKILSRKADGSIHLKTLYGNEEKLLVSANHEKDIITVQNGKITYSDVVVRDDGVVHGINTLLVPISVQKAFNSWKEGLKGMSRVLAAVQPEASPTLDRIRNSKPSSSPSSSPSPSPSSLTSPSPSSSPLSSPSSLPQLSAHHESVSSHTKIETPTSAPVSSPSAPASASASSPSLSFNGQTVISDFVSTLVAHGGYDEVADLLVNLTSLAPHLAQLVKEGHRLTILAPNDEAMDKLTIRDLADPNAPENLLLYHIIPEYQTEESFYSAVKKFGSVSYSTLRGKYEIIAHEEDGTVMFNQGKKKARLIDIDIFTNAHISVQGLDGVLIPAKQPTAAKSKNPRKLIENDHGFVEVDTSD